MRGSAVRGHVRRLSRARRTLVDAAGRGIGLALAGMARARRGKAVHPHGAVHEAELVVPAHAGALGDTELFGSPGTRRAIVRFSRSVGLPRPLPDLLGMSLRIPDAYGKDRHQDFLLVTSIDAPVAHHLFVPAADVQQRPYSSSLPYRVGARRLLVGALPRRDSPRGSGRDELERLAAAAATRRLVFDLAVAEVWGRFRPVAELRVRARLPDQADALRFNPFNAGGGIEPVGVLNGLREQAYPMSQAAWARAGRAQRQLIAERVCALGDNRAMSEQPNLYELTCGDTRITYSTSSFAGPPQLSYAGERGEISFSGEEIATLATALGTEVTATLDAVPDLHTVTLTLLVPDIRLEGAEQSFQTLGVITTTATTIAGPPSGAAQTYEVLQLDGVARSVDF